MSRRTLPRLRMQPLMFAELQRVRLSRDVASEGYCLCGGLVGTVVSVYGGGKAYAVEFANVNGKIVVIKVGLMPWDMH